MVSPPITHALSRGAEARRNRRGVSILPDLYLSNTVCTLSASSRQALTVFQRKLFPCGLPRQPVQSDIHSLSTVTPPIR